MICNTNGTIEHVLTYESVFLVFVKTILLSSRLRVIKYYGNSIYANILPTIKKDLNAVKFKKSTDIIYFKTLRNRKNKDTLCVIDICIMSRVVT